MPDPRINIRITRHVRDLAVLILLDLSESTNERVHKEDETSPTGAGAHPRVHRVCWPGPSTRSATPSRSTASPPTGGTTCSTSASRTSLSPTTTCPKSRLAGMKGGLSTRMGAALRHAGWHLSQQPAQRKLRPADHRRRARGHRRARPAVPAPRRQEGGRGPRACAASHTYCLTLDPTADRYVARIFGENRYSIIDHVERLPERLPGRVRGDHGVARLGPRRLGPGRSAWWVGLQADDSPPQESP